MTLSVIETRTWADDSKKRLGSFAPRSRLESWTRTTSELRQTFKSEDIILETSEEGYTQSSPEPLSEARLGSSSSLPRETEYDEDSGLEECSSYYVNKGRASRRENIFEAKPSTSGDISKLVDGSLAGILNLAAHSKSQPARRNQRRATKAEADPYPTPDAETDNTINNRSMDIDPPSDDTLSSMPKTTQPQPRAEDRQHPDTSASNQIKPSQEASQHPNNDGNRKGSGSSGRSPENGESHASVYYFR